MKSDVCDDIYSSFDLTFVIDEVEFKIPLQNIAVHINHTAEGTTYCQSQIAYHAGDENVIILGGAFYTAFLGIFDV